MARPTEAPDHAIEALLRRAGQIADEMEVAMREAIASGDKATTKRTSRWAASLRVGLMNIRDARHLPYLKTAPSTLRDQLRASLEAAE